MKNPPFRDKLGRFARRPHPRAYARDSWGRFRNPSSPPPKHFSRAGIAAKGKPGVPRFETQRQATGWVQWAYTSPALTKKQAEAIFRARGGSKKFFESRWRTESRVLRNRQARARSMRNQRKEAARAGVSFRTWRSRHAKGTRLYWEGAAREEWIGEFYPQLHAG